MIRKEPAESLHYTAPRVSPTTIAVELLRGTRYKRSLWGAQCDSPPQLKNASRKAAKTAKE